MSWMDWYNSLTKPSWTPAPGTIGLIWQILYPIILVNLRLRVRPGVPGQGAAVGGLVVGVECPKDLSPDPHVAKEKNIPPFLHPARYGSLNHSDEDLQRVVDDLQGLGVQKVGATHCSGEKAISKMKDAFGDGFFTMGVGRVIEVGE